MESLFLIPLVAVVLFLSLLVVLWLADSGFSYVVWALSTLEEDRQLAAEGVREKLFRRAARKGVERRFAVAGASAAVDYEAVEAVKQMPVLRRLIEHELPAAVVRCNRIHQISAGAVGARYIWEVMYQPECLGSRHRVVALGTLVVEGLERYPFLIEDEALEAYLVLLRDQVVPKCSRCPYLHHAVIHAPSRCPTAEKLKIPEEAVKIKR